jgi:hypothetical protein
VKSDTYILAEGAAPRLRKPAVRASIESELMLRASTTKWKDWAGWVHGNSWLGFYYKIDDVVSGLKAKPFEDWSVPEEKRVWLFPLGDEDISKLNERMNTIYGDILREPMKTSEWPIRKVLSIFLGGAGTYDIHLSPSNKWVGIRTNISSFRLEWIYNSVYIGESQHAEFSDFLRNWVWIASQGRPPEISKLYFGD